MQTIHLILKPIKVNEEVHTDSECWQVFIHSRVKMFAGEKADPAPLTNQSDVGMWIALHKKL